MCNNAEEDDEETTSVPPSRVLPVLSGAEHRCANGCKVVCSNKLCTERFRSVFVAGLCWIVFLLEPFFVSFFATFVIPYQVLIGGNVRPATVAGLSQNRYGVMVVI